MPRALFIERRIDGGKLIPSLYRGKCCECGDRYGKGDSIVWYPNDNEIRAGQSMHSGCAPLVAPKLPELQRPVVAAPRRPVVVDEPDEDELIWLRRMAR